MEAYAETASKAIAEAENALRTVLDQKEPNYAGFESILDKLRPATSDYIFLTFPASTAKAAEDRLWDGHVKVNKKFQKHLKHFREGPGKKKHVERRKAEKHYLQFIKASMQFYRGHIQRLASSFQDVKEVGVIASKLHLDTLSLAPMTCLTVDQKNTVLASCHNALMRLGDLTRYRETELEQKNRNWGPAKGHYELALSVKPESGAAYNQLAVMALADDDHLRAVYYLHRAAATSKPFPVARDNIRVEFEKLLKFEPAEKSALSDTSKQTLEVLENRFLAFHANAHSRPSDFVTYTDKATQILQLVTVGFEEIKDRSLDKLIQKMSLVSISAEYLAWTGTPVDTSKTHKPAATKGDKKSDKLEKKAEDRLFAEHQRNCQAFYLLQRFNILSFTTLLKIAARELASASDKVDDQPKIEVPPSIRRLLPQLRQYSSWLLTNIHALLHPKHQSTGRCLDQFWKAYIRTANLLLSQYPISEIADLDHLLEEDEDTLAFAPFSTNVITWRYNFDNGPCKPAFAAQTAGRPVDAEMLSRIRRFVFDAATITNQKAKLDIDWAPIALVDGEFVFQERPAVIVQVVEKPKTPSQPFRSRAHVHATSLNGVSPMPSPKPDSEVKKKQTAAAPGPVPQLSTADARASENVMEDMVDKLVSHQPLSNGLPPASTPSQLEPPVQATAKSISPSFNSSSLLTGTPQTGSAVNIMDIVRDMQKKAAQSSPKPAPKADIMDIVRGMQQKFVEPFPSSPVSNLDGHLSGNASLPGIWNTAFTPRPGEATGHSPRPGTASGSTALPGQLSGTSFQNNLMQQEREIQLRTSPYQPIPFSSWPEQQRTPTFQPSQLWETGPRSPWHSPATRSPSQQYRQVPQTALFGAIGEPRKSESQGPPATGRTE